MRTGAMIGEDLRKLRKRRGADAIGWASVRVASQALRRRASKKEVPGMRGVLTTNSISVGEVVRSSHPRRRPHIPELVQSEEHEILVTFGTMSGQRRRQSGCLEAG